MEREQDGLMREQIKIEKFYTEERNKSIASFPIVNDI